MVNWICWKFYKQPKKEIVLLSIVVLVTTNKDVIQEIKEDLQESRVTPILVQETELMPGGKEKRIMKVSENADKMRKPMPRKEGIELIF